MKPKEYISKYNMNGIHSFNHNHFVADLSNDFMATIELLNSKGQLNLKRFEVCVKEIRQKFDSIFLKSSNIKKEEFEKIWKYFYATTIVKVKDDLFGEVIRKQKEREIIAINFTEHIIDPLEILILDTLNMILVIIYCKFALRYH